MEKQIHELLFNIGNIFGGTGEKYPTNNNNTPTTKNAIIRSTVPELDKSTKNNFATTTPIRPAPIIQVVRCNFLELMTIITTAIVAHNIEKVACTN